MSESSAKAHPRPYGKIFLALLFLTIAEVFMANLPFHKTLVVFILVFTAFVKAALVAMFYMHLKFEKIFLTVTLVAPLIFTLIFVLMIGWDVGYFSR